MVLNKKRMAVIATVVAATACGACLIACNDKKSTEPTPPAHTEFEFRESNVYLEKYSTKLLLLDGADGLQLSFASSDETVASVSGDGTVTARGEGSAVITASGDGANATVTVNVSRNKSQPVIAVSSKSVTVAEGGKFFIEPTVTYKDVPVDAVYTFSANGGLTVDNSGEITGTAIGSYVVTVTAEYVDITLTQNIDVKVISGSYFHLDRRSAEIYLSDAFGDGNTTEQTLRVYTDSTSVVTWSTSNPNVATVTGGVVTPVGAGVCTVTASADGMTASATVTVKKPQTSLSDVKEIAKTSSTFVLDLNDHAALFSDKTMDDFTVTQNSGVGVDTLRFDGRYLTLSSDIELGEQILRVETDEVVIDCPVVTASMIISSKDDFKLIKSRYFGGGANSPTNVKPYKYRDGYFILDKDIDFGGETFAIDPRGTNSSIVESSTVEAAHRAQVGWYGVLDGRGHVVKNIVSGKRGLFGNVEKDSEIKNIAFIGTFGHTDGTSDSNSGFVAEVIVGKLDNVLVAVDKIPVKETANANADLYGKAGVCTLLYGEINNTVCAITSVQNSTATGFNPSVIACRVEGNPIDEQAYGSMKNTFGLARGNLTAVATYPNHIPSAFRVVSGFGTLKNTVDIKGFRSFWGFADDSLSFGSYVLRF
ncbi:MAG: hypothetical protein HDT28_07210 [Clostridiales bacterium]|nr:hypothetical protein [Clostridiales bacterium]